MTAPVFVDTNILVYAADTAATTKQPLALAWMERLWRTQTGRISSQVLQEYYVTVTRKLKPGLDHARAQAHVRRFFTWDPVSTDPSLLDAAWAIESRSRLSWWDALIVAAARRQRCAYLLSEDFSDGAEYDGVTVVDPLRHSPDAIFPEGMADSSGSRHRRGRVGTRGSG